MIKMTQLVIWMQQLGFISVRTHLNSGNVIFQSDSSDVNEMSNQIRKKILQESKLDVACLIGNKEELMKLNTILTKHQVAKPELSTVYVTFLSKKPPPEAIEKLNEVNNTLDAFTPYDTEIVLVCQQPYHKTKLSNNFFEKVLKVEATSRNRNTIEAMLNLLHA
jgi:uncharacterized protein (DUF1697 family)